MNALQLITSGLALVGLMSPRQQVRQPQRIQAQPVPNRRTQTRRIESRSVRIVQGSQVGFTSIEINSYSETIVEF